jgi:hypothetical protein
MKVPSGKEKKCAMEIILVVMLLCAFFSILGSASQARKRQENLKRLREFEAPNIHGTRRFATDKDLKKGKLI